jgi:hypothetical protein
MRDLDLRGLTATRLDTGKSRASWTTGTHTPARIGSHGEDEDDDPGISIEHGSTNSSTSTEFM